MPVKIIMYLLMFASAVCVAFFFYPFLEKITLKWQKKKMDKVAPKLDEMFLDVPFKKLMLMDILAPVVTGGIGYFIFSNITVALACGAVGLVIPVFIVKKMEQQRRKKFASQLVDGLMILSSSLKAGLSLLQSFEALIEEMPPPISQEFSLVVRQIHMGVSLDAALHTLKKRMRVEELDLMVTAIMVARETGGNLTEIFSQVANTIQERNKLIGRVNALCIQGKLQGAIMSLLPVLFAVFVYKVDPHFFDIFFKDQLGRMLLTYAVISQILGVIFIRKFSKIDI